MNVLTFAQAATAAVLVQWIVILIVIAGVIGIALIVSRQAGIAIPAWIFQVFWVIVACVIGVIAIRYLATLL